MRSMLHAWATQPGMEVALRKANPSLATVAGPAEELTMQFQGQPLWDYAGDFLLLFRSTDQSLAAIQEVCHAIAVSGGAEAFANLRFLERQLNAGCIFTQSTLKWIQTAFSQFSDCVVDFMLVNDLTCDVPMTDHYAFPQLLSWRIPSDISQEVFLSYLDIGNFLVRTSDPVTPMMARALAARPAVDAIRDLAHGAIQFSMGPVQAFNLADARSVDYRPFDHANRLGIIQCYTRVRFCFLIV